MKHAVKTLLIAALLAMSPSAFAADLLKVGGGVALMFAGGGWLAKEYDDADDSVARARATNCMPSCDSDDYVVPGVVIGGAVVFVGGLVLAITGFSDKEESDYFTERGLHLDGMTFGYTDTGAVGLQKKWEF